MMILSNCTVMTRVEMDSSSVNLMSIFHDTEVCETMVACTCGFKHVVGKKVRDNVIEDPADRPLTCLRFKADDAEVVYHAQALASKDKKTCSLRISSSLLGKLDYGDSHVQEIIGSLVNHACDLLGADSTDDFKVIHMRSRFKVGVMKYDDIVRILEGSAMRWIPPTFELNAPRYFELYADKVKLHYFPNTGTVDMLGKSGCTIVDMEAAQNAFKENICATDVI